MKNLYLTIKHFFGIERSRTSKSEKIVATMGGLFGITVTFYVSYLLVGIENAVLLVPSMGASAVLLFALPHGALSQPWSLIMGNLISAVIGVTCYLLIPNIFFAAGLAVGLSIGAMHLLNCIHPPGGATALIAVIGGPVIHELGYFYVLSPIGVNVLIIFFCAIAFNSMFGWRRYPISMMRFIDKQTPAYHAVGAAIESVHIEEAMKEMDLVVDIAIDDLKRLFALTLQHAERDKLSAGKITTGHYYTNGRHGKEWSVRFVVDEARSDNPEHDMIIYRCSEGADYGHTDSCTRSEFLEWAQREVIKKN